MKSERYIPALRFDWLTPLYDTVVRRTTREKLFKNALVEQAQVAAKLRVLDLACGTGTLAILLKRKAPQAEIVGIDGDPEILGLAREKARDGNFEIRFDEGMSFDLPYPDEYFDRAVSSLFFNHLTKENKLKTFGEVRRVLAPEGELHVADWGLPANFPMKIASRFIQLLDGFETTANNFDGRLPALMKDAGFEEIKEMNYCNTMFGTIRLHRAVKP